MAGYLGWNIRGNFEFAMQLRGATAGAMLVAAFAGHAGILNAYRHAVEHRYRFFSYGDAMFITRRPAR